MNSGAADSFRAGRGRRFFAAALLLLAASAPGSRPEAARAAKAAEPLCRIEVEGALLVGNALTFRARCPDWKEATGGAALRLSWEFGDGKTLPFGPDTVAHYAYSKPGDFVVFLRMEGEIFPANKSLRILPHGLAGRSPPHSASMVFDSASGLVLCVNPDHGTVSALRAKTLEKAWEKPVGKNPRSLALDGRGLVWAAAQDDASLTALDVVTGEIRSKTALPRASRPSCLVIAPGTGPSMAYVALEARGTVAQIDLAQKRLVRETAVFPTPKALALDPARGRLLVTRFISPAGRGEVAVLALPALQVVKIVPLQPSPGPDAENHARGVPNALQSVVVSPDGKRAWVAGKKDNTGRGLFRDAAAAESLTFQSTVRSTVCLIDLETLEEETQKRLDLDNRNLPSAITLVKGGLYALIATAGSNDIIGASGLDARAVIRLEPPDTLNELTPIGLVAGPGDSLLFVHNFLGRSISVWDLSGLDADLSSPRRLRVIPIAAGEPLAPAVLRGKRLFHNSSDDRMSRDNYLSCASCHMDGGSDGRVWDFTDRGEGLRRTTSLLGRKGMGQGPVHWSANFDEIQDFEHDMRGPQAGHGFLDDALFHAGTRSRTLGDKKAGLSPDLDALAAYLESLAEVQASPHRAEDGSLTPAALRGKAVFHRGDVGCFKCHGGPAFTDSRLPVAGAPNRLPEGVPGKARSFLTREGFLVHDVGTRGAGSGRRLADTLQGFDTPTLLGAFGDAAYLHDGSASTLREVITVRNPEDKHGRTSHLSSAELDDLVAYLRQIDGAEAAAASPVQSPAPSLAARGQGRRLLVRGHAPADKTAGGRNAVGKSAADAAGRSSPSKAAASLRVLFR